MRYLLLFMLVLCIVGFSYTSTIHSCIETCMWINYGCREDSLDGRVYHCPNGVDKQVSLKYCWEECKSCRDCQK